MGGSKKYVGARNCMCKNGPHGQCIAPYREAFQSGASGRRAFRGHGGKGYGGTISCEAEQSNISLA